ncbi:MAG: glycosyltransferase family 4 protein [Acidimicrobiales bacterium]
MITLSPSSKAEMLELGFHDDLVDVVPPGVDPRFSPAGQRDADPTVLAVGRLEPVKRLDRLIRAVAEARRHVPTLRLTVVGSGHLRADLEALVDDLGAGEAVTFAGHVADDELLRLYRRSWMVASSSVREGWGMTLTEAAACATPAVATRIAGHVDAVDHGVSGLLATDEHELAEHIATVAGDPVVRDRLGAGALAHAGRFTWEATAVDILGALADDSHRRRDRVGRVRTGRGRAGLVRAGRVRALRV